MSLRPSLPALAFPALAFPALALLAGLALAAPAAARADAPASVRLLTGVHPGFGRLALMLSGTAAPAVRMDADGIELRFAGPVRVNTSTLRRLPQLAGVAQRKEGGATILLLRLQYACSVAPRQDDNVFYLDFRREGAGPSRLLGGAASPPVPRSPPPGPSPSGPAGVMSAGEAARLRESLTTRLALLNGTPPAPSAHAAPSAPAVPPPPSRPLCRRPPFDLSGWRGSLPFRAERQRRRAAAARATEGAPEIAALAELYAAYGLAPEALDTAASWHAEDPLAADRKRLAVVGDVARLERGEPVDPASPLLAEAGDCAREDLPLWRAAAAAAAGDAEGIWRNAARARAVLRDIPDPVRTQLALRIGEAAGNDAGTLRGMSAVLRNATITNPIDEARRLVLEARLARVLGSSTEELAILERAAVLPGIGGLQARLRLAILDAGRGTPGSAAAERRLTDFARTYRYEPPGQEAAVALAERRLARNDYAGALAAADDGLMARSGDSQAAGIATRILRRLLLPPPGPALPPPPQRLALFWRYEGYVVPGTPGDDIRLGAARLMLAQHLPDAARDLLQELSPASAASEPGLLLRAAAAARTGTPQAALAMLAGVPDSDEARRVAATALARLDRPAEAAARLDGVETIPARQQRAALLLRAADWPDAAAAYAALLADPALPPAARTETAERAALAAALAGVRMTAKPDGLAGSKLAATAAAIAAIPPAQPGAPVAAVRAAIARAHRIETLLSP